MKKTNKKTVDITEDTISCAYAGQKKLQGKVRYLFKRIAETRMLLKEELAKLWSHWRDFCGSENHENLNFGSTEWKLR